MNAIPNRRPLQPSAHDLDFALTLGCIALIIAIKEARKNATALVSGRISKVFDQYVSVKIRKNTATSPTPVLRHSCPSQNVSRRTIPDMNHIMPRTKQIASIALLGSVSARKK
jgi:hypothetical protein